LGYFDRRSGLSHGNLSVDGGKEGKRTEQASKTKGKKLKGQQAQKAGVIRGRREKGFSVKKGKNEPKRTNKKAINGGSTIVAF